MLDEAIDKMVLLARRFGLGPNAGCGAASPRLALETARPGGASAWRPGRSGALVLAAEGSGAESQAGAPVSSQGYPAPNRGAALGGGEPGRAPRKGRRRWAKRVALFAAGFLVLSALSLALAAHWALSSERALRYALLDLPAKAGYAARSDSISGSVLGGFRVGNYRLSGQDGMRCEIDGVELRWAKGGSGPWARIALLKVGRVFVVAPENREKESKPAKMPKSIGLPIDVEIDRFEFGGLALGERDNVAIESAAGYYSFSDGMHSLFVDSIVFPWATASLSAFVEDRGDFPVVVGASAAGELGGLPVSAKLDATGSLSTLNVDARLSGAGVGLRATGLISPFGQGLAGIARRLEVNASNLNPKVFWPSFSRADLSLIASIQPRGPRAPESAAASPALSANSADLALQPRPEPGAAAETESPGAEAQSANGDMDGFLMLENYDSGGASDGMIPLDGLSAFFVARGLQSVEFDNVVARLIDGGSVEMEGSVGVSGDAPLDLSLRLADVKLSDFIDSDAARRRRAQAKAKDARMAEREGGQAAGSERAPGRAAARGGAKAKAVVAKAKAKIEAKSKGRSKSKDKDKSKDKSKDKDKDKRKAEGKDAAALRERAKPPLSLFGSATVKGPASAPTVKADLSSGALALEALVSARGEGKDKTIAVEQVKLGAGKGKIELKGEYGIGSGGFLAMARVSDLNPDALAPGLPDGSVNGDVEVSGSIGAPGTEVKAKLNFGHSQIDGKPFSAKGGAKYADGGAKDVDLRVALANNRIEARGAFGKPGDRLNLDVDAPNLAPFGFGLAGSLTAKGYAQGEPKTLSVDLAGSAANFKALDAVKAERLSYRILASPDLGKPLAVDVKGSGVSFPGVEVRQIDAQASGTLASHAFAGDLDMSLDDKDYRLTLRSRGGFDSAWRWTGDVSSLNLGGAAQIRLLNAARVSASSDSFSVSPARWGLFGGSLDLGRLEWAKGKGFSTKGTARSIDLSQLDAVYPLGFEQNLVVTGDWDFSLRDSASGYIDLRRESGDVAIPGKKRGIGLASASLRSEFRGSRLDNRLGLATDFGRAEGRVVVDYDSRQFGASKLAGQLRVDADDLGRYRYFMPVGMDLRGRARSTVEVSGSVSRPELSGPITAEGLEYRDADTGLRFENGSLAARFDRRALTIDALSFAGKKEGDVVVSGDVTLEGNEPVAKLKARLDRFSAVNMPDRKVTLSGEAQLDYSRSDGLALGGKLKLDEALLDFPKSGMPRLSDDVTVLGEKPKAEEPPLPFKVDVELDLNNAFRFKGEGLDILMGGRLQAVSSPDRGFRLLGTVYARRGMYRAYGQDLEIESGAVTFSGPADNPSLRIRAKRRNSPVGVGVDVSGTVEMPSLDVFADQPLSDKDKLAWLILGRAPAGERDDEALALAAGSLLAGSINNSIGLFDEIGVNSRQTTDSKTGEVNPAEQMVTVGKNITDNIYLGYEYGLNSSSQLVKLVYSWGRSLKLIGAVGTEGFSFESRLSRRYD